MNKITLILLLLAVGTASVLNADPTLLLDHVVTDERLVALTFDDGPDAQTLELMRLIEAEGGQATFFVVGKNIEKAPEILRQSARAGHEIGNHSFTHGRLTDLSPNAVRAEIVATQDLVEKITGHRPVHFRAPFLDYNDLLLEILREERLQPVNADIRTRDWDAATTTEAIVERVTGNLAPGSIVLMHSWPETTLAAIPEILCVLREKGYRMVTVSALMRAGSGVKDTRKQSFSIQVAERSSAE
jgi:peptidoglycan/xylan/chitin deacetylase (PgdA/CDA1 family)